MTTVPLLTRAGSHLSQDARPGVRGGAGRAGVPMIEIDVDDDPELRAEYGDMVPVVLIDGIQHGYFRIDGDRLERALLG